MYLDTVLSLVIPGTPHTTQDLKKIMHQCQRCYAVNRRAESPLQLYLTSFSDKTMSIWDKQFCTYRNWDVRNTTTDQYLPPLPPPPPYCSSSSLHFFLPSSLPPPPLPADDQSDLFVVQVHRKQEGFMELFDKESVVFLTSDSPNILTGTYMHCT